MDGAVSRLLRRLSVGDVVGVVACGWGGVASAGGMSLVVRWYSGAAPGVGGMGGEVGDWTHDLPPGLVARLPRSQRFLLHELHHSFLKVPLEAVFLRYLVRSSASCALLCRGLALSGLMLWFGVAVGRRPPRPAEQSPRLACRW